MKKSGLILSLFCLFGLSGCFFTESKNDIDGDLRVKNGIGVVDMNGATETLQAGKSYNATLHMTGKGSDLVIETSYPVHVLFPEPVADKLGKFNVAASASKQSFDASGEISETTSSNPETGSESCVYNLERIIICRDVFVDGPNGKQLRRICHEEVREIYGHQYYRGIREIADRNATFEMRDPTSKALIASYAGSYRMVDYLRDKVYTSACFR